jgi:uncharacterized protein (DUF305 family)
MSSRVSRFASLARVLLEVPIDRRQPMQHAHAATHHSIRHETAHGGSHYARFAAMIAVSTVVMFGLMYLNTYQLDHVFFSETRAYMALVMGATMALVMLAFMRHMLPSGRANAAIVAGAVAVFAIALWLVRSQSTVEDVSYMKAMIPHHSIAIMTSERAHISDPRVRKLADGIIESQRREIGEMKDLIRDLQSRR